MALRYLLPAVAVAGRAAASCSAATSTLQNSGDASALSTCSTFSGSIAIATNTPGEIAINGVQRITGSLIASNVPNMTSLSGDSLQQIDDSFTLDNVQILTNLNFPELYAVDTVDWTGLPNLQGLSFTTGLQKASTLSIQNTELGSLNGINLQEIDTLLLANNNFLDEVSMQLGSVSTSLNIEANGRSVQVSFPNLEWAYNMTFRNVSSISVPSLSALNGSLGFYTNYMTSLSAPNLTSIGGGLAIVSNPELTNVSMPELKTVLGGLQIANNTAFGSITGFPSLTTVDGAIDFNGEFTTVALPQLNLVKGAFNIQSTKNLDSSCAHFEPLHGSNNIIRGPYVCAGELGHPGGTGTLKPGTNSGSGGASASSSSPANAVVISGATGLLGVVAAMFGML